jgi:hypothetical protein
MSRWSDFRCVRTANTGVPDVLDAAERTYSLADRHHVIGALDFPMPSVLDEAWPFPLCPVERFMLYNERAWLESVDPASSIRNGRESKAQLLSPASTSWPGANAAAQVNSYRAHLTGRGLSAIFASLVRTSVDRCEYVSLNVLQDPVRKGWRNLRDGP